VGFDTNLKRRDCRCAICFGTGEEGELPDTGLTDARARRSACDGALRLFLPENWTSYPVRLRRTGVPIEYRAARTKPESALEKAAKDAPPGAIASEDICQMPESTFAPNGNELNDRLDDLSTRRRRSIS
jgi:hypothetical protein